MNRRKFLSILGLTSLTTLLTNNFIKATELLPEQPEINEWDLGKYLYHKIGIEPVAQYTLPILQNGTYHRYVSFPLLTQLTVIFEKGRKCYYCYNVDKDMVDHITSMNKQELFCHVLPYKDLYKFKIDETKADPNAESYHDFQFLRIDGLTGKTKEFIFKLSYISYKENNNVQS